MLATIGYIVPEYYKFPGFLSPSQGIKFADVPNGLAAIGKIPKEGLAQFAAFIAFLELVYNKPSAEPGNYGKGNLGLGSIGLGGSILDYKLRAKKLNAEMANGRLAMVAIIGMHPTWSLRLRSPDRPSLPSVPISDHSALLSTGLIGGPIDPVSSFLCSLARAVASNGAIGISGCELRARIG